MGESVYFHDQNDRYQVVKKTPAQVTFTRIWPGYLDENGRYKTVNLHLKLTHHLHLILTRLSQPDYGLSFS